MPRIPEDTPETESLAKRRYRSELADHRKRGPVFQPRKSANMSPIREHGRQKQQVNLTRNNLESVGDNSNMNASTRRKGSSRWSYHFQKMLKEELSDNDALKHSDAIIQYWADYTVKLRNLALRNAKEKRTEYNKESSLPMNNNLHLHFRDQQNMQIRNSGNSQCQQVEHLLIEQSGSSSLAHETGAQTTAQQEDTHTPPVLNSTEMGNLDACNAKNMGKHTKKEDSADNNRVSGELPLGEECEISVADGIDERRTVIKDEIEDSFINNLDIKPANYSVTSMEPQLGKCESPVHNDEDTAQQHACRDTPDVSNLTEDRELTVDSDIEYLNKGIIRNAVVVLERFDHCGADSVILDGTMDEPKQSSKQLILHQQLSCPDSVKYEGIIKNSVVVLECIDLCGVDSVKSEDAVNKPKQSSKDLDSVKTERLQSAMVSEVPNANSVHNRKRKSSKCVPRRGKRSRKI